MPPETEGNVPEIDVLPIHRRVSKRQAASAVSIALFAGLLLLTHAFYWSAPNDFAADRVIKIPRGSSLSETANLLVEEKIIRSPLFFKIFSQLNGGRVTAGSYYFERQLSLFSVISRLSSGRFDPAPFKITFPEGANNREYGLILDKNLPNFNRGKFIELAQPLEGQLFPDTYFFVHRLSEQDIIDTMHENFLERIRPLEADMRASKLSVLEVATLASIIEEETYRGESRFVVSGILHNRLRLNMPLQVDATFLYETGKNTYNLTSNDLKKDSPYNTYVHKGLPPGPITNPGLESLTAAVRPASTTYLYYLSNLSGQMYYATTFAEHKINKAEHMMTR